MAAIIDRGPTWSAGNLPPMNDSKFPIPEGSLYLATGWSPHWTDMGIKEGDVYILKDGTWEFIRNIYSDSATQHFKFKNKETGKIFT